MDTESMNEKDVTMDELEETAKSTDQQLELLAWKMDSTGQELVPVYTQDACVHNLMKSVSEVRADYRALRAELQEVQALQRELSARLRAQLRTVHGKFARLRQRLAQAPPPQMH